MESRLAALARLRDEEVDPVYGSLLIAAEQQPELDVTEWQERLDALGQKLCERMPEQADWTLQLSILNHLLFQEEGFTGADTEEFDPRDSFLDQVLMRKSGIPITLSLVYLHVGRVAGMDLQGISFPGHFLVKLVLEDGEVVIDPYNGGIPLTPEQLEARLHAVYPEPPRPSLHDALRTADNKAILARVLRNLKVWYISQSDWMNALWGLDRILLLEPDSLEELRERGEVYCELECFRAAHADLSRYVSLSPEADEIMELREKLLELQQSVARLN